MHSGDRTVSMSHWVWRTTVWRMWRESLRESGPAVYLWVNTFQWWNCVFFSNINSSCLLLSLWLRLGRNWTPSMWPWNRRVYLSDRSHRYFLRRVRAWIRLHIPSLQRVPPLQHPLGSRCQRCSSSLPGAGKLDPQHHEWPAAWRWSPCATDNGAARWPGQHRQSDGTLPTNVRGSGAAVSHDKVGSAVLGLAQSDTVHNGNLTDVSAVSQTEI